jgi:hypothetical protein
MTSTTSHAAGLALLAVALVPVTVAAQTDSPTLRLPEEVKSMGQPPIFKPYMAGQVTWIREGEERIGGLGVLGIYKDLILPVSGGIGLSAEGYFGGAGSQWDGGGRLFATSRVLFLNLGVDYNAQLEKADFILAFTPYFRRGGIFGLGGNLRIEWIPGRNNSWNFGFQIPLEPHMGKTRPRKTQADLPKAPPPASSTLPPASLEALDEASRAGMWLVTNANLFNEEDDADYFGAMDEFRARVDKLKGALNERDAQHPDGHTFLSESRHYHQALDRAFAGAVGPAHGRAVADAAREALLDEVLLPYDRLIGQFKKPDTLRGLAARARVHLASHLDGIPELTLAQRGDALGTLDRLTDMVDRGREVIRKHWSGDPREVWLPLTLAVRAEDHDSQAELNALIERAVERPFTRGNTVLPTTASRFQIELVRAIRATEDYHLLWIHDYSGKADGGPDTIAHAVSLEYIRTLTRHVRDYDQTGRLPTFMIFNTEFFYDGSDGRLFLTLLENPMHHRLKLGKEHRDMELAVEKAQEELRQAVAGSEKLQAVVRERGEGWLRKVIKVHVSITLPADLSFRTPKLVSFLPFAPDSLMLDHRKLFFYDVTEEDPSKGEACFTGTGVGQEYAGPTWDDRGLLVSGPSLLELKAAARRMLHSQGFKDDQIPEGLRVKPRPANYDDLVAKLEASGRDALGLNVHNDPGFAAKQTSMAQAILYTMAPADTLIVVPDSIWTNTLWAGQLAGAALRGCHVYIVAPSQDNAPAAGLPLLAQTREVFGRLFELSQALDDEIAAAGGNLRVGLYTRATPVDDTLGSLREVAQRLRDNPWLLDAYPMPANILEILDQEGDALEAEGYKPHFIAKGTRAGRPKVHRKTQLFATREALRALADMPSVHKRLPELLRAAAAGTSDPRTILDESSPLGPAGPVLTLLKNDPPPGARDAIYYLTVGSKNQDFRSAFLDGETEYFVAGLWALVYYPDFLYLMANTDWIEKQEQFEELITVEDAKSRKLGRWIRKVL